MFCRYCGKQIPDGGMCDCPTSKRIQAQKAQGMNVTPSAGQQRPEYGQQAGAGQQRAGYGRQAGAGQQKTMYVQKPGTSPAVLAGKGKDKKDKGGLEKNYLMFSFALSTVALILFILLRFVLVGPMMDDTFITGIYPYLMYIIPVIAALAACLMAVFALQSGGKRMLALAALAVSVIIAGAVVVTMVAFPYEVSSNRSKDDEDEEEDEEEDTEEEDEKGSEDEKEAGDSEVASIKEEYEAGELNYIQVKQALNALDMDDLSDDDMDIVLDVQETAEAELASYAEDMVSNKGYMELYATLYDAVEALDGDAFALDLMETYEPDFILYLEEESRRLAENDQMEDAMVMLEEASQYLSDAAVAEDLMESVEKIANGGADYILPDSNKRYLTMDDVENLTLQEINYAKNEIYARHGRRFNSNELQTYFDSKSWYNGTISPGSFSSSVFNQYESYNSEFLAEVEFSRDSRGYLLDQ